MKNLREIRKLRGLSQADLAEMVQVKQATISRIEGGQNAPSMDVVERCAKALGVNAAELLGMPDEEERLLEAWRQASPERRAALLRLLQGD